MTQDYNPFAVEPEGGSGKTMFGLYQIVTKTVRLETGASWSDPRYTTKDGAVWAFKGKKPDKTSKNVHVVQDLTCIAKDEHEYVVFADWMYWKNDKQCAAVLPSHKTVFGDKLDGIFGKKVYVQAEMIEIVDGEYTRRALKIVKTFKTKAAMEAEREAFFAKFGEANGAHAEAALPAGYEVGFGDDSRGGDKISAENWIDFIVDEVKKGRSSEKIATMFNVPLGSVEKARLSLG